MPFSETEVPVELMMALLELPEREMPMLELEVPRELVMMLLEFDWR